MCSAVLRAYVLSGVLCACVLGGVTLCVCARQNSVHMYSAVLCAYVLRGNMCVFVRRNSVRMFSAVLCVYLLLAELCAYVLGGTLCAYMFSAKLCDMCSRWNSVCIYSVAAGAGTSEPAPAQVSRMLFDWPCRSSHPQGRPRAT